MFSQEKQKNDDLQNIIQKMKDKEDNFIQEKDQLTEENKELKLKIKKSEEDYSTLQCKLEEQSKYNEAFVAEQRKTFTEKLKKREDELKELTEEVGVCKEYKSKYIDLQQEYTHLMQKYAALQEDLKKAQVEKTQQGKKVTDAGSKLHKQLLELQSVKEKEYQELKQQRQYYNNTFREKDAKVSAMQVQLLGLRQRAATQKQQLEEKSYRLSTLESSLNEFQELSYSKEEKLKSLEEEVAILKKALENNEKIQKNFEKVLKSKEESLERKEKELQLQKKEHADEINTLHNQHKRIVIDLQKDIEIYKSQMISEKETHSLKMEKVQCDVNLEKNAKDKFKNLENELKNYTKTEKILKRQIKQKDADVKEKTKHIESLEKNSFIASPDGCNFDFHWYPYLSFPAKRITPSITIVQEKVYVTSGYQSTSPQGQELESYFKCSEVGNEVFCFNTGICRCDTITSPVKLGALASVNGQCVLVSGADSVGNTLTGNVYVLCEEGSHDQWKEFSKPLPTPRILACACCYDKQWLIVCGGFTFRPKEESNLFEAVSIVEILDTTKGEWYTLSEENCPNFSTILCCTVVGEDVYVVGSDQVIKTSCNNLIKAATSNNTLVWDNVQIETEESNEKLYPFSVVEVNGEPMIIASMTDGEDDVTCVLMKDTRGRWRIMSKAVECQHCSAAVITSSLELLLFGGSEKISVREATDISQKSTLTSTLDISSGIPMNEVKSLTLASAQSSSASSDLVSVTPNQPANVFFTGPIHTAQFDHNGGTFQSPIHKVSLVVPPNALSDGEKVTVYMGATTSGPFDLPEDCKLRSAVVWLSISPSDVVFKKNLMLLVPHSAIFTSPKHHCMMRFVICEDRNGIRYKFSYSSNEFEIDEEQGLIELSKLGMVAIIANPGFAHEENEGVGSQDSDKNIQDAFEDVECLDTFNGIGTNLKKLQVPLARYLAKLFWPRGELPSSFKTDIYYLQCLPTELYKVNQLYRKVYYEENGAYPEIVETEFMISGHGANLQCILPCNNSSKCDCLTGWDVTPLTDLNVYVEKNEIQHKVEPMKFSFKFSCLQPDATCNLTCCFEFHGVENIRSSAINRLPLCLQERSHPFILEKGIHCGKTKVSPIEGQAVLHSDEVKMAQSDEARSYQATDII